MKIKSTYTCHPGLKRINNQDNIYYNKTILNKIHGKSRKHWLKCDDTSELICFGVFDGMGGEQFGEVASYLAAQKVKSVLMEDTKSRIPSDILFQICKESNQEIWEETVRQCVDRIGTTIAAVIIQYNTIWCCNIGDSKILRYRDSELCQLSMDHVAVAANNPIRKPGLTAHLGMNPCEVFPNPFIINEKLQRGDKYIICSDGVTDMVSLEELSDIISKFRLQKASEKILKTTLEHGGIDNATFILFEVK